MSTIKWEVWDKTSDINGVSAERYLSTRPYIKDGTTVYIKRVNGRATEVQCKPTLAHHYGIDPTLDDQAFIEAYEAALAALEAAAEENVEPDQLVE